MHVQIIEIDLNQPVDVPGAKAGLTGYQATFECPLVSGEAVVVPAGSTEHLAPGRLISVETSQEAIQDFQILSPGQPLKPTIVPQLTPGDYEVCGPVSLRHDDGVFIVEVGGFAFWLEPHEARDRLPRVGQWVSFLLYGLILWEEGN